MLSIRELNKTYEAQIHALKGISLDVSPGMFGLLGPNGSGKTTLMKILATLLEPDSGSVEIDGIDLIGNKRGARQLLGYLPQEFGFYPSLTAEQMLNYLAKLKGIGNRQIRARTVDTLLERVNLASSRKQKLGGFSGGMRQRLGIAQALIGKPLFLIVDEPTAGLDPEERVRFHNLLANIASQDSYVMLSTHIVSDVSGLCNQMAIIRQGEIVASCSPREATNQLQGAVWEASLTREQASLVKLGCRLLSSQLLDGMIRLRVLSPDRRPGEEFHLATPTVEDYYLSAVGRL